MLMLSFRRIVVSTLRSARKGEGMTRYVLTTHFRDRVRATALAHHELTRIGGVAHADFNRFLHGTPFGPRSRQRLLLVGAALGLTDDKCCEIFPDPIFKGQSSL